MNAKGLCRTVSTLLLCIVFTYGITQVAICPPNIDFETGNFSNWECRTGTATATGSGNVFWSGNVEAFDRHTIISASSTALDPYGQFPVSCPNGSGYSIRLGNGLSGSQAEGLFYTYTIPSNVHNFSILYYYAIVFQDPGHPRDEQPRFIARVVDVATNLEINCVSFDFTASASLPGFQVAGGGVVYKDWTPISVDLSDYAGKTIRLEFITRDCTRGEHFGYAYIDVSSICNGLTSGSTICSGDSTLLMSAPFGFQSYAWYSDNSFSSIVSTTQTLFVNPAPLVGTTYPVIVTPYPNFGCVDTLYVVINAAQKPPLSAGPDQTICNKQQAILGTTAVSTYNYTWTPVNMLSGSSSANPKTILNLAGPVNFTVRTTDLATGCFSLDTTRVTPIFVDTSSSITGKDTYCPGEPTLTTLTVNNPGSIVQWVNNNGAINNAVNLSYQPLSTATSTYFAQIIQNGCMDSSRSYLITVYPLPKVGFTFNRDVQCLNSLLTISNTTTIPGNVLLTYTWKFSDGSSSTLPDISKTFTVPGDVIVKLIANTPNNCADSLQKTITVMADCSLFMPSAFTPNGDGLNDILKPFLPGMKNLVRFTIFNRYGNVVFSSTKEGEAWDGTVKGVPADPGVFVWMIEYITNDDKTKMQKGVVTLIR